MRFKKTQNLLRNPRSHCRQGLTWLSAALSAWALVGSGAPGSDDLSKSDGPLATELHWSLQPLVKPTLPKVKNESWARTAIDRFILAKLEEKGLQPSPAADKRTLLRRVYFDLLGLPPTPEEMNAFVNDKSSHAYEKIVDRLLASPRHGERWARHWLDVVHYAETHGHDQDRVRTNSWPYRDYVIDSINSDKPYARFVEEQIAGDALFPSAPEAIVAMGFLATGPWDESSLRDIRDDTIDRQVARYLDRDDIVMTVMNTFVSATVQCARCHDHKFDPISQQEYYGLQAVFAATDKANRPYDADSLTSAQRRGLLKQKNAIDRREKSLLDSVREPAFQKEVAAWESSFTNRPIVWTPLKPAIFVSSNGSTLTLQPDGSILAGGTRPDIDTYAITGTSPANGVTAVRLEVLTDQNLPHKGPGRQDNGNLHLTDFRVLAAPDSLPMHLVAADVSRLTIFPGKIRADSHQLLRFGGSTREISSGGNLSPQGTSRENGHSSAPATNPAAIRLTLQNPSADFNQAGWGIAQAIDDDPKTAWGIYPEVGKPHQAVFEMKDPIPFNDVRLTFVLEQNHGGGHLIGRARLSVTTNAPPISINALPEKIVTILATPGPERTREQQTDLALFYLNGEIERKIAALPHPKLVFAGASDFAPDGSFKPALTPRPVHLLKRGDINKPGEVAVAGALSWVSGLSSHLELRDLANEGERRAALAKWITDPKNTLTWRSIVNRVWHYHFGRGIVDSPNDFGHMGGLPAHPEVLDWLALNFRESGGSLKQLHRLIVTSAVYRQASSVQHSESRPAPVFPDEHSAKAVSIDADNRYLWRMNRSRLDAESVRDAVLQISGKLDLKMGGPSVMQFILSPGIHVTPVVDYARFDIDSEAACRRSIYRFIFRTLPDPFMDTLDCADSSQLTPVRNLSVTALQALAMLNDRFIIRQSEHFAERVSRMTKNLDGQITAIYQLALNRAPRKEEAKELADYARKYGLANLCRVVFNSNEFMFLN